jgi:redox-sensitive bicupin YhaK (pirin superfamily)
MDKIFHPASKRGYADHGWLKSYHSFSFAHWYDPNKIHFGALRVLNDDYVAGGGGFGTHPHDNMEIISIPLSGDLKHKDSMGTEAIIRQGDVQIMSAGTGVSHSEINASRHAAVKFLQIWIFPKDRNIRPRYDQRYFNWEEIDNGMVEIVSPMGGEGIGINQDAWLTIGNFASAQTVDYTKHQPESGIYIFNLEGELSILDQDLGRRDALGITSIDTIEIKTKTKSQFLIIEVPMKVPGIN